MNIDKTKPVMVTGATGYVAGWLVKKLLEDGLTVHAAVRNPDKKEKTQHLDAIAKNSPGTIKYFRSDLLELGSYAAAMEGCEVVFHTASPFSNIVKDPQKELIEPAVKGTRNVLEQANKTTSVKRIVLTSSCAAIYSDATDLEHTPNGMFTEEVWNTTASLDYQPYSYSKTLAEKEAWSIAGEQSNWDLVVINPSFVMGPFLNPESTTSESFRILEKMGNGALKTGAPKIGMGVIDVRDLAIAHYRAGFNPEAEGRNIISAHNTDMLELARILHKEYGDKYPIPNKAIPKWLLWLVGPMVDKAITRRFVSHNVNHEWKADNSKSKERLGMTYRPLEETMVDSFEVLVKNEIVKPSK
ncbi:MAG: NAD-dependent epimerase/dehydratase family protein [Crocinitomicaceae bacterium]|nr:NAD-dependent epimerase/dehydratase family protein [Crocinitomicaceae bacterium]